MKSLQTSFKYVPLNLGAIRMHALYLGGGGGGMGKRELLVPPPPPPFEFMAFKVEVGLGLRW